MTQFQLHMVTRGTNSYDQLSFNSLFTGDFNSDELTDVFVLRDDFKTIEILLGSDVDHLLHQTQLRCHYPKHTITSIVPGDFDGDAFMDVMFTVRLEGDKIGVFINWGGSDHLNCSSNDTEPIKV